MRQPQEDLLPYHLIIDIKFNGNMATSDKVYNKSINAGLGVQSMWCAGQWTLWFVTYKLYAELVAQKAHQMITCVSPSGKGIVR